MISNIPGIHVQATIGIDHLELGRQFAGWNNEDQALFLFGMHLGLEDMDFEMYRNMQLMHMAEFASRTSINEEIKEMLELFLEYINA